MNKLLGILLSASAAAWPTSALLAEVSNTKPNGIGAQAPTPRVQVVPVTTESRKKQSDASSSEAAIAEIDKCLTKASSKAKELAEVIRNAKKEKLAAQIDAKKTKNQLGDVKKQMEQVRQELASMKKRETKNRSELKDLESKLASSTKKAADESNKLLAAANDISRWEKRATKAEGELRQTRKAMEATLRVANEAKALGSRYQEKLTLGVTQLAERESTLKNTLASLKLSREAANKCQAKVTSLQIELDKQSKRYEAVAAAMKKAESERDSYRKSKLAAEKSLTRLKGQLASLKTKANKLPKIEKELAAARKTLNEKQQAETAQARVAARLAKSSDQMKDRLNEILMEREELHDNLTILRNEFAQYRITSKGEQDRFAKESVNLLQASLARESTDYRSELEKRDARLAQLEKALKEKEEALQATYKREKATSSKLSKTAESRDAEARARQSLLQALKQLRTDLESSQKKACKLQEQLVDLESLSLEN